MALLQPSEFDQAYFDGGLGPYQHLAGYNRYSRWQRTDLGLVVPGGSRGEFFADRAAIYAGKFALRGKTVLEIGCAKGFLVGDLRTLGVDAWGLDVSPYAIGQAEPAIQPYLTVGDIRTAAAGYGNNQWAAVLSLNFLCCFSDVDLATLIPQLNRISKQQVHLINESPNPVYYNVHPLSWWTALGWDKGTTIVSAETGQSVSL